MQRNKMFLADLTLIDYIWWFEFLRRLRQQYTLSRIHMNLQLEARQQYTEAVMKRKRWVTLLSIVKRREKKIITVYEQKNMGCSH
jgi:hypothetical protein